MSEKIDQYQVNTSKRLFKGYGAFVQSGIFGISYLKHFLCTINNDPMSVDQCSCVSMLYSTSLLAFTGSSEDFHLSPRQVIVFNTHTKATVAKLAFPSAVLNISMSRKLYERICLVHLQIIRNYCFHVSLYPHISAKLSSISR